MTTHEFTHIGLSGCELQLITNKVIRKKSPSIYYNDRLQKQLNKQLLFKSINTNIHVPKVLANGYSNDLFYFDMEYIDGNLFSKEFITVSKPSLDAYVYSIISYINETEHVAVDVYSEDELKTILTNKLISLKETSNYTELLLQTIDFVNSKTFSSIKKGTCHGDLTLSNILFSNGNIYLLDFLDSYIESYIIDIVKLKQDLYYNWNVSLVPFDSSLEGRIKQVFRYMWGILEENYGDIINTDLFNILDLINLLRIEPYTKTEVQKNLLHTLLQQTKLYEKFNNSNDGQIN
jgi:tRNA A-37 threonylcarbamoyl transferase component Bud32